MSERGVVLRCEAGFEPLDADTLPPWIDGCEANGGDAHVWKFLGVTTICDPPQVDYSCTRCRKWASRNTRDERVPSEPIKWRLHGPHEP